MGDFEDKLKNSKMEKEIEDFAEDAYDYFIKGKERGRFEKSIPREMNDLIAWGLNRALSSDLDEWDKNAKFKTTQHDEKVYFDVPLQRGTIDVGSFGEWLDKIALRAENLDKDDFVRNIKNSIIGKIASVARKQKDYLNEAKRRRDEERLESEVV